MTTTQLFRISGPDSLGLCLDGMTGTVDREASGMARVEMTCWPGAPRWVRVAQLQEESNEPVTAEEFRVRMRKGVVK